MLLWVNWCVFSPSVFLGVLLTLFPYFSSIRLLCYVLFVTKFCSKIVLFPCHLVVGMTACNPPLLAGWILFRCFEISCLVCIVLSYLDIFIVFFLLLIPSSSGIVIFTCVAFSFQSQRVPAFFLCFIIFACCRRFLICVSSRISQPGFEFLLVFFFFFVFFFCLLGGTTIFS